MIVTADPTDVSRAVKDARDNTARIGLVPTMGALHEGHLSLVQAARDECRFVVVSLFVNPTQFGPHEDFDLYPRPLEADLTTCRNAGVNLVFHPETDTIYPDGCATFVEVDGLSQTLEGRFRPGHFRGVTTVVLTLLNIVRPDVAYFGHKDYQQQLLIRQMCRDLALPVEIRTCPTVRAADGLALSSRNRYLDAEQRRSALTLWESLSLARDQLVAGKTDLAAIRQAMHNHLASTPRVNVDYATIVHPDTLEEPSQPLPNMIAIVAARVDDLRLIDNLPITLHTIESAFYASGPVSYPS